MQSVIQFADNVLKYGRDKYRPEPTPLFADGIDVKTHEHAKWRFPNSEAVISNLANQQNLMRTLVALSKLTGDSKYRDAAAADFQYHFDHFTDANGLLLWGGHCFIDLATLNVVGPENKGGGRTHELKDALPFYDFMYEVNPEAATKYIRAFWNAHMYDWADLLMGRHGSYGLEIGDLWKNERVNLPVFRDSSGLSFLNAGNDMIYSACLCYKNTGDKDALDWAVHFANQYVRARDPKTGLGAYQFTQPKKTREAPADDQTFFSWYGDRCKNQFGPEFGESALEGKVLHYNCRSIYSCNPLIELNMYEEIGEAAKPFLEWTVSGLRSFAQYCYIPEQNATRWMFTDGTDLTGYELKRDGYYGKKGTILKAIPADGNYLLGMVKAYSLSDDTLLWDTARSMAKAIGLGDIGKKPGDGVSVNLSTDHASIMGAYSLVELYKKTSDKDYLELAKAVAENLKKQRFNGNYFVLSQDCRYAKFDSQAPLALMAVEAASRGRFDLVPPYLNGSGFINGEYKLPDGTVRNIVDEWIYRQTDEIK